jgi:uncharacterized protein YxeA
MDNKNGKDMKRILITMTLLLALGMGLEATAQKHRHTPMTSVTDSTSQNGIDAFSDTTATDSSVVNMSGTVYGPGGYSQTYEFKADSFKGLLQSVLSSMDSDSIAGMLFLLGILLILFVLAPLLIIIALFYFINRNRKEKMRLAQMAMQQGQPIPDQLLNDGPANVDEEYQKGMRQCFVGVGLMIFLGYAAGSVGFGVGALVFCIGLGKVFASKTANRRNDNREV